MSAEEDIQAAIEAGRYVVCYQKCWACNFGDHVDPPEWHTWADGEDIEHAASIGRPDPSTQRCGCDCAGKGGKS